MARVTVEDCIVRVPNRFELVLMAAQRAREIGSGGPLTVERDNDKNPVVALREIADGTVAVDGVRNALIQSMQKHVEHDEPEEDELEAIIPDTDFLAEAGDALADEEMNEDGLSVHEDALTLEAEADAALADEEEGDEDGEAEGDEEGEAEA